MERMESVWMVQTRVMVSPHLEGDKLHLALGDQQQPFGAAAHLHQSAATL